MPYRGEEGLPVLAITGTIGRSAGALSIHYAVAGDLSAIAIPAAAEWPERKDRLWEGTCLELFLGAKGSEGYWEFNLSPAGHWNVFRFTSYREGMQEEPAYSSLPFDVRTERDALLLSVDLEPWKILPECEAVEVGVCAVIRTAAGGTSHWALAHPGPLPDFHRRDGFALTLPGELRRGGRESAV